MCCHWLGMLLVGLGPGNLQELLQQLHWGLSQCHLVPEVLLWLLCRC